MRIPALILVFASLPTMTWADPPVVDTVREDIIPEPSPEVAEPVRKTKSVDWVALPIPISNPTIGSGLGLAALALYRVADAAKPSSTGMGAFKTDNGSWGGGVLQETYLGNTGWQVNGVLLKADLNLDFFGIGVDQGNRNLSLPISQDIEGGALWVMAEVVPGFSIGPRYRYDRVRIQPDADQNTIDNFPIPLPPLNVDLTESTLEWLMQYDTRDSRFGPTQGWFAELSAAFTDKAIGSDVTYQKYTLAANWYRELMQNLVLGARVSFCDASESAPFFALCQFGLQNDLRGYVTGRYRDRAMFATQAELRWRAWRRFGAVFFGGVGNVADKFGDLSLSDPLTSIGIGIRYLASKENRVNVGIDVAYAKSDYAVYFRIGEAF